MTRLFHVSLLDQMKCCIAHFYLDRQKTDPLFLLLLDYLLDIFGILFDFTSFIVV